MCKCYYVVWWGRPSESGRIEIQNFRELKESGNVNIRRGENTVCTAAQWLILAFKARVEKCDEQKDYVRKAMARVDENQKRKQTPTASAPLGLQT